MLSFLFSLINPLKAVSKDLLEWKLRQVDAETEQQRIEANVQIETLTAQKEILLAEQKDRLTKWIRPAIALPIVLYLWKVIVWDTVFGLGVTGGLSNTMEYVLFAVVGAYFTLRPVEKIFRKPGR